MINESALISKYTKATDPQSVKDRKLKKLAKLDVKIETTMDEIKNLTTILKNGGSGDWYHDEECRLKAELLKLELKTDIRDARELAVKISNL